MRKSIIALTLSLASGLAMADGLSALDGFLHNVHSGQADFTQTVTSPERDGQPPRVTKSSGTFAFERPGKFRFDYQKPFEQLIVGDGRTLWIYDADLNQATARDQTHVLDSTPAALISYAKSRAEMEKSFNLADAPDAQGLQWVVATPKAQDGQVRSVRMGFDGDRLEALDILDAFGQNSELRFEKQTINQPLSQSLFTFAPPPGTDVIHDTQ